MGVMSTLGSLGGWSTGRLPYLLMLQPRDRLSGLKEGWLSASPSSSSRLVSFSECSTRRCHLVQSRLGHWVAPRWGQEKIPQSSSSGPSPSGQEATQVSIPGRP